MRLDELLTKSFEELDTLPLDKVNIKQIESSLKQASSDEKKKLEKILELKKILISAQKARKYIKGINTSDFE